MDSNLLHGVLNLITEEIKKCKSVDADVERVVKKAAYNDDDEDRAY